MHEQLGFAVKDHREALDWMQKEFAGRASTGHALAEIIHTPESQTRTTGRVPLDP